MLDLGHLMSSGWKVSQKTKMIIVGRMWLLATTLTLSSEMLVLILYAELKNKVSRELPLSITGQVLRF